MGTVSQSQDNESRVGGLLHRITDDVKTIARDEIELAKHELAISAKHAATESAAIVLGGIVALIGFGMLCATAVAALAGVIPPLWARLLIMAVIYLVAGGAIAAVFAKRLKEDIKPDMTVAGYEAKRTIAGIKDTLAHS
jgi:uncharacterized membrane protein YqjE